MKERKPTDCRCALDCHDDDSCEVCTAFEGDRLVTEAVLMDTIGLKGMGSLDCPESPIFVVLQIVCTGWLWRTCVLVDSSLVGSLYIV